MAREEEIKELHSDDNDPLFNTENMLVKTFPSDFRQIRYFTLLITSDFVCCFSMF